jgi:hypothetical protein
LLVYFTPFLYFPQNKKQKEEEKEKKKGLPACVLTRKGE